MKVSIGKYIKKVLSDTEKAKLLITKMIRCQGKDVIRIKNVIKGKVLILRKVTRETKP